MIRPLRIVEEYRAVSERAALQSCPCWSRKIRRGLQYNRDVRCSRNSESESIAVDTQAGIADLELRIPEHWIECAPQVPTRCTRQVINGRVGGVYQDIQTIRCRSVSSEIHSLEIVAVQECIIADTGEAASDRDVDQTDAILKCLAIDACDAVGNRDARQACAIAERRKPDAGDVFA